MPVVKPQHLGKPTRGDHHAAHTINHQLSVLFGFDRQKTPKPTWRTIPDDAAEQLFSVLRCHRDRALISFWLSTGARAAKLLGLRHGDLDVGARVQCSWRIPA